MRLLSAALTAALALPAGAAADDPPVDWSRKRKKAVTELATRWLQERPRTRFEDWEADRRAELEAEARAFGPIPEGAREEAVELIWKPVEKHGPRVKGRGKAVLETPYGEAWFYVSGSGKDRALIVGLHGGGEGAGSADEARGNWQKKGAIGMYPQGIRLVHDTWNTVHGERFALTLIEIAKAQYEVDPDRVYCMGFSMGGTGSWFLAGRHPDLFAGASPCAGVFMASPASQVATVEEVEGVQHGLIPNVRNLAMWYYIGLEDTNCMPGTYLYVADRLEELRAADPGGYGKIHFQTYPNLAHAFPPGEPRRGIDWLLDQERETFPSVLTWEYASDPYPLPGPDDPVGRLPKHHFYWLHCAEPRDNQRIRAELVDNEIRLELKGTADGARGITLFLNERMIDPEREVVVRLGEEELYRGQPEPDLWTVLETFDARLDRSMVFDRRIELR